MKRKTIILFLSIIFFISGFTGCLTNKQIEKDKLANLDYKNYVYGFGLNPPVNWTADENNSDVIVSFLGPDTYGYRPNIVVTAGQLVPGQNLSKAADEMLENYSLIIQNFTLISREELVINKMNTYILLWASSVFNLTIKQMQIFIEKDSKVLILTYSSDIDIFDNYKNDFENMVNTIKIIW